MTAVAAIAHSARTLRRNPNLVGVVAAIAFVTTIVTSVRIFLSGVANLTLLAEFVGMATYPVVWLASPFVFGGLVTMVDGAFDGPATVESFVTGGRSNYVPLLVGWYMVGAILFVAYVLIGIGGIVALTLAIRVLGDGLLVFGVVSLCWAGIAVVPLAFVQFFPAAIVLDDVGVVDSVRRSVGLLKSHPGIVIGFDAWVFVTTLLSGALVVGWLVAASWQGSVEQLQAALRTYRAITLSDFLVFVALQAVVGTVIGSIVSPAYVAVYRSLTS
jgi:hypothetical protein